MANKFTVWTTFSTPTKEPAPSPLDSGPILLKIDLAILGGGTVTWNGDIPVPHPPPPQPGGIGFVTENFATQQVIVSASRNGQTILSETIELSSTVRVTRQVALPVGGVTIKIESEP